MKANSFFIPDKTFLQAGYYPKNSQGSQGVELKQDWSQLEKCPLQGTSDANDFICTKDTFYNTEKGTESCVLNPGGPLVTTDITGFFMNVVGIEIGEQCSNDHKNPKTRKFHKISAIEGWIKKINGETEEKQSLLLK